MNARNATALALLRHVGRANGVSFGDGPAVLDRPHNARSHDPGGHALPIVLTRRWLPTRAVSNLRAHLCEMVLNREVVFLPARALRCVTARRPGKVKGGHTLPSDSHAGA